MYRNPKTGEMELRPEFKKPEIPTDRPVEVPGTKEKPKPFFRPKRTQPETPKPEKPEVKPDPARPAPAPVIPSPTTVPDEKPIEKEKQKTDSPVQFAPIAVPSMSQKTDTKPDTKQDTDTKQRRKE